MKATFKVGQKVKAKEGRAAGIVTEVLLWNSSEYHGYVYNFRNGYGQTYFSYRQDELTKGR